MVSSMKNWEHQTHNNLKELHSMFSKKRIVEFLSMRSLRSMATLLFLKTQRAIQKWESSKNKKSRKHNDGSTK